MSHEETPPQYTDPELLDEQSWDDLMAGKSVKGIDPVVLATMEQFRTEVLWQKAMREAEAAKKNDEQPTDELSRRRVWKAIQAVQEAALQAEEQAEFSYQAVGQKSDKHRLKSQWKPQRWFALAASVAVVGIALSLLLNITYQKGIDLEGEGYVERSAGQIVLPTERQVDDPRQAAIALVEHLTRLGFSAALEKGAEDEPGVVYVVISDPLGVRKEHQAALRELGVRLVMKEGRGIVQYRVKTNLNSGNK